MRLTTPTVGVAVIVALTLLLMAPPASPEPRPLTFGVHPYLSPSEVAQRFTPLVRFLQRASGRRIDLTITQSYQAHIAALGEDRLDIAYVGPAPYLELTARFGTKPLLGHLLFSGQPHIRGVIATRDDNDLQRLDQLRGRRFAFGNRHSTLSHRVPWHQLRAAGIEKEDFGRWSHLNGHSDVALAILLDRFDAGAMKETVFLRYRSRGLRALAYTPVVPSHLLVASATLGPALTDRLREALLGLSEDEARRVLCPIGEGVTGIAAADDRDFDPLRQLIAELPVSPP